MEIRVFCDSDYAGSIIVVVIVSRLNNHSWERSMARARRAVATSESELKSHMQDRINCARLAYSDDRNRCRTLLKRNAKEMLQRRLEMKTCNLLLISNCKRKRLETKMKQHKVNFVLLLFLFFYFVLF